MHTITSTTPPNRNHSISCTFHRDTRNSFVGSTTSNRPNKATSTASAEPWNNLYRNNALISQSQTKHPSKLRRSKSDSPKLLGVRRGSYRLRGYRRGSKGRGRSRGFLLSQGLMVCLAWKGLSRSIISRSRNGIAGDRSPSRRRGRLTLLRGISSVPSNLKYRHVYPSFINKM